MMHFRRQNVMTSQKLRHNWFVRPQICQITQLRITKTQKHAQNLLKIKTAYFFLNFNLARGGGGFEPPCPPRVPPLVAPLDTDISSFQLKFLHTVGISYIKVIFTEYYLVCINNNHLLFCEIYIGLQRHEKTFTLTRKVLNIFY